MTFTMDLQNNNLKCFWFLFQYLFSLLS